MGQILHGRATTTEAIWARGDLTDVEWRIIEGQDPPHVGLNRRPT